MRQEAPDHIPDVDEFNMHDFDTARRYYLLLEETADGMGGIRPTEVNGQPYDQWPETLVEDVRTLRWLVSAARREHEKRKKPDEG